MVPFSRVCTRVIPRTSLGYSETETSGNNWMYEDDKMPRGRYLCLVQTLLVINQIVITDWVRVCLPGL